MHSFVFIVYYLLIARIISMLTNSFIKVINDVTLPKCIWSRISWYSRMSTWKTRFPLRRFRKPISTYDNVTITQIVIDYSIFVYSYCIWISFMKIQFYKLFFKTKFSFSFSSDQKNIIEMPFTINKYQFIMIHFTRENKMIIWIQILVTQNNILSFQK